MTRDTLIKLDSGVEIYKSNVSYLERKKAGPKYFVVMQDNTQHSIEEHEFWYYFEQFKFEIRQA
ncbi:MAG: hypothetical protein Q8R51_02735 [Azonexus sp.]|nr:hypothetical protein [Deltaproteobacteria bacterium]MDP3636279.1 hypothetical protein [Azonexus sp.]